MERPPVGNGIRKSCSHAGVLTPQFSCEELGCYGAAALVERHADELRDAYFIALDIVGAGDPGFLVSDGLLRKYPVDRELLAIGRQVAAERPELRAFEHVGLAYTDTAVLKRGFRGLTIDALRREGAGGAYWHRMADTVDKIEPDCLRRVHEFAWEMLQRLDAEGTQMHAELFEGANSLQMNRNSVVSPYGVVPITMIGIARWPLNMTSNLED